LDQKGRKEAWQIYSLLYYEGRTEADPVFLTKKGRNEKDSLLGLDDLIEMYKGGKASV
jgi:hypothetical protein